ncbi:hypothetical protein BGZ59_005277 [Podila verticillata]|nr:hypothetical protein BGZ59_005277 [Podila verticillata]
MTVPDIISQYSHDSNRSVAENDAYSQPVKPQLPLTQGEIDVLSRPKVIIAGGGLSGLTLAILLKQAKIPFVVLERAKEIKPLGSAILLGAGVGPLFQQMGIYEEFKKIGKYTTELQMFNENLKPEFTIEGAWLADLTTYKDYVVSRPDLYDLLWRHVPRENIRLGKRVLSYVEEETSITVNCSDNSVFCGDILVGADGAYSAVRQHLYKNLKATTGIPPSDDIPLPFSCVCLVGQTTVLDPEDFPELKSEKSHFTSILGLKNLCTWLTFSTKKNTMCWMVIQFLNKDTSKQNDSFRNSEWGPEPAEAMAREVRAFKVPGGKDGVISLAEYIDRTPKEYMAKVMLEEIVFETWHDGRAVLMGDACHKMNPAGGVAGLVAIHDAVALANWLSTLHSPTVHDMNRVFKEYRAERYPVAKQAFRSSQMYTKFLGKSMLSVIVRAVMKRFPDWLWRQLKISVSRSRPQVSFLPLVEDKGSVKLLHQPSLHKTLAINKERAENPQILSSVTASVTAV